MMHAFPFIRVNAFSSSPKAGNPCVVVFDTDPLSDADRLALARDVHLAETAFVLKPETPNGPPRVKYFTPVEEIPLAGHPTLATAHALRERGLVPPEAQRFSLQLTAGLIDVFVNKTPQGTVISMTQMPPRFLKTYAPTAIAPLFDLAPDDLLPGFPLQVVDTGAPMLMMPVRDLAVLRKMRVHLDAFAHFAQSADFFCVHTFCLGGFSPQGDTAARDFAPPPDVVEDTFTGSATGAMGCYMVHYNLIRKLSFTAEQGHDMGQPGTGYVGIEKQGSEITGVRVGGQTVTTKVGFVRWADRAWDLKDLGPAYKDYKP